MLVLTRKQGETIRIGDDVTITVIRTKGKAVRLGILAPAAVPVLRGEIANTFGREPMGVDEEGCDATAEPDGTSETLVTARRSQATLRRPTQQWSGVTALLVGAPLGGPLQAQVAARAK